MEDNHEKININFQNANAQSVSGSGRRRGHQHHIRYSGTRTSTIEAEEILTALRKGDQMPITETYQQYYDPDIDVLSHNKHTKDDGIPELVYIDSPDDACTSTSENAKNQNYSESLTNKNLSLTSKNLGTTELSELNVNISDISDVSLSPKHFSEHDNSTNSKAKLRRLKRNKANVFESESSKSNKEIPFKQLNQLPPMEERPPLEGADSDQWTENIAMDVENDPEVAEWSKLRCTSERTEVIAEREYRRQNRRCADYPGLAFGRSIFSSDTMMKLNIIRNELHNIMKTQLKRVRVMEDDAVDKHT